MSATVDVRVELPELDPLKKALFEPPGPVADQTFELGLVLGGTVSAGAYTAGALDLLVQALDAFHGKIDPPAPHKVILRLASGSSGGAVCAAILGLSLNRQFTHVDNDQAALNAEGAGPADNKFWDVWVNKLSFLPMLDTDDLAEAIQDPADPPGSKPPPAQHVPALLNGKVIDGVVAQVVAYADQAGNITRPWTVAPFRLATTVATYAACHTRSLALPKSVSSAAVPMWSTTTTLGSRCPTCWESMTAILAVAARTNSGSRRLRSPGYRSLMRPWEITLAPAVPCRWVYRRGR
jgi:hypothetical protein